MCVCVCVCEGNRFTLQPVKNHSTSPVLTAACVLQIHSSIIVLMVKLRILLTVFIFSLKAEAQNYGKQRYISDVRLWCSDNHNALDQLANQNRLCLSKGGVL